MWKYKRYLPPHIPHVFLQRFLMSEPLQPCSSFHLGQSDKKITTWMNKWMCMIFKYFVEKKHLSDGLEHHDNLQIKSSWFWIVSESDVYADASYIHYMICRPGFSSGPGSKSAGSPSALFWILCWPVFVLSLEVLVLIWDGTRLFMLSFDALSLPSWVCTSRTLVW